MHYAARPAYFQAHSTCIYTTMKLCIRFIIIWILAVYFLWTQLQNKSHDYSNFLSTHIDKSESPSKLFDFENTQLQRLERIRKFCRSVIPNQSRYILRTLIYDISRNLIALEMKADKNSNTSKAPCLVWCPVYKAASSNWFYR